jgi:hypothetical protein
VTACEKEAEQTSSRVEKEQEAGRMIVRCMDNNQTRLLFAFFQFKAN